MVRWSKVIPISIIGALLLSLLILILFNFGFLSYFNTSKDSTQDKYLLEKECSEQGGIIISSNELGKIIVHNPTKVCAFLYEDAEKECYDNNDCIGACILGGPTFQEGDELVYPGKCQKYINGGLNCTTERREGRIIQHSCVME